jgi:hypothetical protein
MVVYQPINHQTAVQKIVGSFRFYRRVRIFPDNRSTC